MKHRLMKHRLLLNKLSNEHEAVAQADIILYYITKICIIK